VATTSPAPPTTTTTLTAIDQGKTVLLVVGDYLNVHLHGGAGDPWSSLRISNDGVLADQLTALLALGVGDAGGAFRAIAVGSVTLTAVQTPVCAKEHPACAQPSRAFGLHVVVAAYS
jgi:hypothetical protein